MPPRMRLSTHQEDYQVAHRVLRRPAMRSRLAVRLMVPPVRPHNHQLRSQVPLRTMLVINHLNKSPRPGQLEHQHPLSPSFNHQQRLRQDKSPKQLDLRRLPGYLVLHRRSCSRHRGFPHSRLLTLGSQHLLDHPLPMSCRGRIAPRSPGKRLSHRPPRYPCLDRSNGSLPISRILSLNIRGPLQTMHNSLHSPASNACRNGIPNSNSSNSNNTCNILPNHHYNQSNKAMGSNMRSSMDSSKRSSKDRQDHDKSLLRRHQLVNRLLSCTQRL